MLSRGHPELDALVGATLIRVSPYSIDNSANKGSWSAHIEILTPDGSWIRRDDVKVQLADEKGFDLLIPGTRQRLVIESDQATKATDWHATNN